jgi:hypothetical protein
MSCYPTVADVDFPIREQLAQVVVGPTIAEPELKHLPVQLLDQAGRHIEAGALSLQAADEAVEPAQDDQAAMPA